MNEDIAQYTIDLAETIRHLDVDQIGRIIDELFAARDRDATIFVIGNGGSAATASHMGNDLNKLTIVEGEKRFRCLPLTDNMPLVTAWGNDNGYENSFVQPLLNFLRPNDVVIGITTSGNSPNVVKAFEVAKQHGAQTILFGGLTAGKCGPHSDMALLVPSDHQGIQEDCHLIFNHIIANIIRDRLTAKQPA